MLSTPIDKHGREAVLVLRYHTVLRMSLIGVLAGMFLTVATSLYYRFDSVTGTHCRVPNFLPTLSAAFRDLPSRLIWQLGILCHLPRAFLDIFLYHSYFSNRLIELGRASGFSHAVNYIQSLVVFVHHSSLLTLTLVTSAPEYYFVHEAAFISFMVSGFVHMLLLMWIIRMSNTDGRGLKSIRRRVVCFVLFTASFAFSMYLFFRHNAYCEPYVYSFYAAVEYVLVLCNITFYFAVGHDFPDLQVLLVGSAHKHD